MLVVVSIACCSPHIIEATVAPNFTSVPILLRFLWHGEKTGVWTFSVYCTTYRISTWRCRGHGQKDDHGDGQQAGQLYLRLCVRSICCYVRPQEARVSTVDLPFSDWYRFDSASQQQWMPHTESSAPPGWMMQFLGVCCAECWRRPPPDYKFCGNPLTTVSKGIFCIHINRHELCSWPNIHNTQEKIQNSLSLASY